MVEHEDGPPRVWAPLSDRARAAAVEWLGRRLGFTERMCFGGGDDDFTAPFEGPDGATVMVPGPGESKGWTHARAPRSEEVSGPSRLPLTPHVTVGVDRRRPTTGWLSTRSTSS